MTNEERHRTMEFILEQQAQFAVNIQRLEESAQRREEERIRDQPRMAELERSFQQLVQLEQIVDSRLDRLESIAVAQEAKMDRLESIAAAQGESLQRLTRLAEITDKRLARLEPRA